MMAGIPVGALPKIPAIVRTGIGNATMTDKKKHNQELKRHAEKLARAKFVRSWGEMDPASQKHEIEKCLTDLHNQEMASPNALGCRLPNAQRLLWATGERDLVPLEPADVGATGALGVVPGLVCDAPHAHQPLLHRDQVRLRLEPVILTHTTACRQHKFDRWTALLHRCPAVLQLRLAAGDCLRPCLLLRHPLPRRAVSTPGGAKPSPLTGLLSPPPSLSSDSARVARFRGAVRRTTGWTRCACSC